MVKRKTLTEDSQSAIKAVVQILIVGYNENEISSILDPRTNISTHWSGSGFFIKIGREDGYILTNAHVVRNSKSIQIRSPLTSEENFKVEIVGLIKSLEPDIALLRLPPEELIRFKKLAGKKIPFLALGDSNSVRRGVEVKAIGYPMGMDEPNISGGEISNFIGGDEFLTERLVTDAAINPGNSGGPSIISGSKVIGLNTAIIQDANNIGFITPINFAKIIIQNFLEKRETKFTDLGATLQRNSEYNSKYLGQKKVEGLIVTKIFKNGLCDRAKLKKWDVILKINDFKFDRHGIAEIKNNFRHRFIFDIIRLMPLGKSLNIEYFRAGKNYKTKVAAVSSPRQGVHSNPIIKNRKLINFNGLILQNLSLEIMAALTQLAPELAFFFFQQRFKTDKCVVITKIEDSSLAQEMGLAVGQAVVKINGTKVSSINSFKKQIDLILKKKKKEILLETSDGSIGYFPIKENVFIESAT